MSNVRATYTHPMQDRLRQRYAAARRVWRDNPNVRDAATAIGMTERAYCDGYLNLYPPLTWTATATSVPTALDYELAYHEGKP